MLPAFKRAPATPPFLIAGPCVIESEAMCLGIAERLAGIADELAMPVIFKASFDKANRTSVSSFRGHGIDAGLRVLEKARAETGLPRAALVASPAVWRGAELVAAPLAGHPAGWHAEPAEDGPGYPAFLLSH